jgi:hypothetical protein
LVAIMITLPQRSATHAGDGLGYRVLGFDKQTGDRLDMLRVRPQFFGHAPFDRALHDRLQQLVDFADPAFARVCRIDRLAGPAPSLVIVSTHVFGVRLADLLSVAESFDVRVDIGTALGLVRQLAVAIGTLHAAGRHITHGCIGPERLLLAADGRLVVTEYILGSALDAMQWPRDKFWYESRIALPATDEPAVFDRQTDIMQVGLLALALLEGQAIYAERRYPLPLAHHVGAALVVPVEGTPQRLSPPLTEWLARALQRDRVSAFKTIDQALTALDRVIEDSGFDPGLSTVADFVSRCRQASPDLKPRDLDTARESERALKLTPAAIDPASSTSSEAMPTDHASAAASASPSAPAAPATVPVRAVPSSSGVNGHAQASWSSSISASLASPLTTIGDRAQLSAAAPVELLVDDDTEPIEFVTAATAVDDEPVVFEGLSETPSPAEPEVGVDMSDGQTNSLLDMEVLVGMLRQPRAPFVVLVDERPLLLVDPVSRVYRLLTTTMADATRAEPPPVSELPARLLRGRLRYRDARKDDQLTPGSGFAIELLLWNLGLVLQPEELLPQVAARDRVQLARWPDFGRIRSDRGQLRMSALLTSRAFGIDDVFDAVGEPRPHVIAFLNACALCGLFADAPVAVTPPSVAHVAPAGRPLGGLMQRLRDALGIGRA